ncbi:MAG: pectinesterase family protein [Paludibacter sp.]|jgi:pectin methylesterase-like acyl-CoA thioesterase|nr:pectinesterase family protein [Paludibacter sp.]
MRKLLYSLMALLLASQVTFATPQKTDVWDFGAVELDTDLYNNQLTVEIINSWYASTITPGSQATSNTLPNFTAGILKWTGNPASDRLRTTNTAITRYDANIASVTGYTGRLYQNGSGSANPTTRFLTMTLNEDDEVTLISRADATGLLNFVNAATPATGQANSVGLTTTLATIKFTANTAGDYKIFDSSGKPSFYRIYRKPAQYAAISGTVDITEAADIPAGYKVVFSNTNGKSWTYDVTANAFNASLPVGNSYSVSLQDANGYIITSAKTLAVDASTSTFNLSIKKVTLYNLTGTVSGLSTAIANANLVFTPTVSSSYVPTPVLNKTTGEYSVQLEDNFSYTISATGVNDYELIDNTVTIAGSNLAKDLAFSAKAVYPVTISTTGLTSTQEELLQLSFTNLDEAGYVYNFSSASGISLRNGTYSVKATGLNDFAVMQVLTSNLKVENAAASKTIAFKPVHNWSFDDMVITTSTPKYKGMEFTGTISNEIAKGHLTAKPAATIKVPVLVGEKVRVTYYYTADFSIEGGAAITTASNSTNEIESTEYVYPGTENGFVTITVGSGAGTTYITDITTETIVPYTATLQVGADKTYKNINDALAAISKMSRTSGQRVTVMIDPGNYEEMLVINQPDVTLKNASAAPSIALANKGVDIDPNAVRITSYYGHGYNYYSMGTDQKWNAELLTVNKENGSLSYENKGSGTTNESYWNATVVVGANGFEAEGIIFENSFNQYISKKESEDVVLMWTSGSKGVRPTDEGNISVQDKSFVERAAAIAIKNNIDKVVLNKCRVIGRQDSFFGGAGARVVVYKGTMMGATDYIFGGMTAVFYKSDLAMNTSAASTDVAYITAAQQTSGRGYLMYACHITSAQPNTETASTTLSKPGYLGRPWAAVTGEVVFYNTKIGTTDFPANNGQSLIVPAGWNSTLSGESAKMYEFGTTELSGENNSSQRVSWATTLTSPQLTDGTEINTFNFTKGSDNWDPIPALLTADPDASTAVKPEKTEALQLTVIDNQIVVRNITEQTQISIYAADGSHFASKTIQSDSSFRTGKGLWIVKAVYGENQSATKVIVK